MTLSMTWITPLLVRTSVATMDALRPAWSVMARLASIVKLSPCSEVMGVPTGTCAFSTRAGATW